MFYDRHAVALLAFFARRVGGVADAADLTSETFVAAFLARHRYRDTGAPASAWLFGIARRQLSHYRRHRRVSERHRRRLGMEPVLLPEHELREVEELVDLQGFRESVRAGLDALPRRQRDAVRLRVVDELPYADVAAALSCSQGAARVLVCRGLSRLTELMEEP